MFNFNIDSIIQSGGLLLIGAIVFAESGLLVGFFLPGDTLLLSAGIFAAQGKLPLIPLLLTIVVAAFIGDNTGYTIGKHTGPRLFKKEEGILFHKKHIQRAEVFYEKHGGKTIILARFIPIVRTFAPVVAGIGKMPRKRFVLFDIFGVLFWGVSVTMIGYWFGSKIPNIDKVILPTILIVSAITFLPAFYHVFKEKETRIIIKNKFTNIFKKSD